MALDHPVQTPSQGAVEVGRLRSLVVAGSIVDRSPCDGGEGEGERVGELEVVWKRRREHDAGSDRDLGWRAVPAAEEVRSRVETLGR